MKAPRQDATSTWNHNMRVVGQTRVIRTHTASSSGVPTPRCRSLPLGAGISSSGTTFGWLEDVLFSHVQGVVIL